ncbi:MAG: T9SS type A sorting domain-containing protein [Bacteroidetes bacterium]|nr:T9SS type A sorting domain-containing protein [Bacteroidota bacterium]
MQPFPYQAYYYVDDVCLSTDSLYNETWTSLIETTGTSNQPIIFPNPSSGFFTINSPIPMDNYCVYNLQGQLILKMVKNVSYKHSIGLSDQAEGLYLIRIQSKYKIYNYKIVLTY